MSYVNNSRRGRGNPNFQVTSSRDGSRYFDGGHSNDHDDRWNRASNGRGPKNRGYRGNQRGGYRNLNPGSSRMRNRPGTYGDEDISMSGDSGMHRSSMRDRFRDRGRGGYQRGRVRSRTLIREDRWFKINVPYGARMSKEELFTLIKTELEEFSPISYHTGDNMKAIFFVKGYTASESLRSLSRRLTKPDGHKLVLHVAPCEAPTNSFVSDEDKEKLKIYMSSRYDASTRLLNLSSLHNDKTLNDEGIYLHLNRPVIMNVVAKIITEYIPELCGLDLSSNKLLSLGHMADLVKGASGVTSLNLGKNHIRNVSELEKLSGWSEIKELVLEGNELCNTYKKPLDYVSAVRKKLPKVVQLDGHDYPPPVRFSIDTQALPETKGSFFLEDNWKNLIVEFVKEYYTIYDSNSRSDLMAAYHENAQFSMHVLRNSTIDRQDGFKPYMSESRNLKRISHHDSDDLAKKIKTGVQGVVSGLNALPKTTHDLNSFTVDVTLAIPSALCFVLHGVFKESENRADKPTIRSFSRTFVTVPHGKGISIINDMLTISNAGLEQSRNAFKDAAPTPSSSPASGSQLQAPPPMTNAVGSTNAPALTDQQKQMVTSFAKESGMNMECSFEILKKYDWNYQQAGQVFIDMKGKGEIPAEAFTKM